jgi:hypothetical protein
MQTVRFHGAAIKEQGVKFAVVMVQPHVVTTLDKTKAKGLIATFEKQIFGVPVVLMGPDPMEHKPRYYGREDLVKFLANVPVDNIPWREFSIAA